MEKLIYYDLCFTVHVHLKYFINQFRNKRFGLIMPFFSISLLNYVRVTRHSERLNWKEVIVEPSVALVINRALTIRSSPDCRYARTKYQCKKFVIVVEVSSCARQHFHSSRIT